MSALSVNQTAKAAIVSQVHQHATQATSVLALQYRGITSADMTELRRQARTCGVHLRVIKNTLARRAFVDSPCECLADRLEGPLLFAFSLEDPGAAARLARDFKPQGESSLTLHAAALDGRLLSVAEMPRLADLPTYEQALSRLAGTMLAPVRTLAVLLLEPHRSLARVLDAVRRQKEGS